MAAFNQVVLVGNLTRDPQLKYLPSGKSCCEGGIAINEQWKDESGQRTRTDFFNFKAYGRAAEVIGQYLKKGDSALLSGRLRADSWEKDGQKHTAVYVDVAAVQMLGKPSRGNDESSRGGDQARDVERSDETLPF